MEEGKIRYEFTRFKTFQLCPLKHHYIFDEGIKADSNKFITLGRLFHSLLEYYYDDKKDEVEGVIREYKRLCLDGKLDTPPDLLQEVFTLYVRYYKEDDNDEDIIMLECEIREDLNETDEFYMRVDKVVYNRKKEMYILRDTKTTVNPLKYTLEDVSFNQQLLLYVPYVERELNVTIDAIEIDEVRLAKLEPVPETASGALSTDKKRLGLVLVEDYVDALIDRGLDTDSKYAPVLEYLYKRGHPLFNRVTAQIVDRNIVDSNLRDMNSTYELIKAGHYFRNRTMLCNYCDYRSLCSLDMSSPSSSEREFFIENRFLTTEL